MFINYLIHKNLKSSTYEGSLYSRTFSSKSAEKQNMTLNAPQWQLSDYEVSESYE